MLTTLASALIGQLCIILGLSITFTQILYTYVAMTQSLSLHQDLEEEEGELAVPHPDRVDLWHGSDPVHLTSVQLKKREEKKKKSGIPLMKQLLAPFKCYLY